MHVQSTCAYTNVCENSKGTECFLSGDKGPVNLHLLPPFTPSHRSVHGVF